MKKVNKKKHVINRVQAEDIFIEEQVSLYASKLRETVREVSNDELCLLIEGEYDAYSISQKVSKKFV